jgi:hypothetical protein
VNASDVTHEALDVTHERVGSLVKALDVSRESMGSLVLNMSDVSHECIGSQS